MFNIISTFTHAGGFHLTPIDMKGVGLIFLPKELEDQLGYGNLSDTIRQSDSFAEEIEYLILRDSKLLELKELLNRRNSIPPVLKHFSSLIVLTEPGLYTVTFLSRKPQAQNFRRWVTGEVLPSIRKTGTYKLSQAPKTFESSEFAEKVDSLEKSLGHIARMAVRQEQFQQYALIGFDRIEAVLADSLPHDIFEGWRKIKGLVDDMTEIYGLSNSERKRYLRELCQSHDVPLPEKAMHGVESSFYDAQELAIKIGVYSSTNKPHSKLVLALIRHLGLDQGKYCRKFPVVRGRYNTAISKYSKNIVPHILKWLQEKGRPDTIELVGGTSKKMRKFRVKYRSGKKI